MNKSELVLALARVRMTRLAESQGHSAEDAKAIADDAIRQGGIDMVKSMATPDGSIVAIVESYVLHLTKRLVQLGGTEHFRQANDEVIAAIEAHRSQMGAKGTSNYPREIDAYVYYRIDLEIQDAYGCNADAMGFDPHTTKILTHTAKAQLAKMAASDGDIASNGSKSCFIATACYGSYDAETVISLRRYRELVLKKSTTGRRAIHWYYKLSPPIANLIRNHPRTKQFIRIPLKKLAERLARKYGL